MTRLACLNGPATAALSDRLAGQFAVVWIAVHPDRRGRGLGRGLLERLLAGAGTERAWWSPTTWTPRPGPGT